jgi:hypothetical protein
MGAKQKYQISGAELAREIGQSEGTVSRKRGQGLTDDQIRAEAKQRAEKEGYHEGIRESKYEADARNKSALADLNELKLAQEREKLVPLADVNQWNSTMILKSRDILLRIAPELKDTLALETDPIKIEKTIDTEVRRALRELAEFHV